MHWTGKRAAMWAATMAMSTVAPTGEQVAGMSAATKASLVVAPWEHRLAPQTADSTAPPEVAWMAHY